MTPTGWEARWFRSSRVTVADVESKMFSTKYPTAEPVSLMEAGLFFDRNS